MLRKIYCILKILLPFLCVFPLLLKDYSSRSTTLIFSFMIPCLGIFDFVLCDSSFTFSSRGNPVPPSPAKAVTASKWLRACTSVRWGPGVLQGRALPFLRTAGLLLPGQSGVGSWIWLELDLLGPRLLDPSKLHIMLKSRVAAGILQVPVTCPCFWSPGMLSGD